jgi:flagellar biogenesis protein FliO
MTLELRRSPHAARRPHPAELATIRDMKKLLLIIALVVLATLATKKVRSV